MPSADFSAWLPDQPSIGAPPHLRVARNVMPQANGYGPWPSLTATTGALDARCRGMIGVRDRNQVGRMFAGDASKLYQLGGFDWEDYSKSGGYTATDSTRWRFNPYGDRLLAANGADDLQYIDMTSGASAFADLAGSPGAPEHVVSYLDFVVIAGGSLGGMTLKWSGINNSEEWTPGVALSDEQELTDGGRITGLVVMRAALYILQEHCIRRMMFVGGDVIMQIDKLVEGVGCTEPASVVQWGADVFFLSAAGWCAFGGEGNPALIGAEKVDNWFISDAMREHWHMMSGAIDPRRKIVMWAYASTASGAGRPDTVLIYNYSNGKWAYARQETEVIATAMSLGVSPDDLTDYVPDDHPEIGPDDPFWLGGFVYASAMTWDHELASFSGDAMEATLTTSAMPMADGRRASVEWIKPIADTVAATIAGGSAVRPGDPIVFRPQAPQQASGRCPQRGVNGFYLAARMVIPAASVWTFARGQEWAARTAGVR